MSDFVYGVLAGSFGQLVAAAAVAFVRNHRRKRGTMGK